MANAIWEGEYFFDGVDFGSCVGIEDDHLAAFGIWSISRCDYEGGNYALIDHLDEGWIVTEVFAYEPSLKSQPHKNAMCAIREIGLRNLIFLIESDPNFFRYKFIPSEMQKLKQDLEAACQQLSS